MRIRSKSLLLVLVFVACTGTLIALVGFTFSRVRIEKAESYNAVFSDASGLVSGVDVRASGVTVGSVESVHLTPAGVKVTFSVPNDVPLTTTTQARIRYANLTGDRYLDLTPGDAQGTPLARGATIPLSRTQPALDLDTLFAGFDPLMQALDPDEVNKLTANIIAVTQGQSGAVQSMLANVGSFTSGLADRDELIGDVITQLAGALGSIDRKRSEFDRLILGLDRLMQGLSQDRQQIGTSIEGISTLSSDISSLLLNIRPDLKANIDQTGEIARQLNREASTFREVLGLYPTTIQRLGRGGAYGSFFDFFLCSVQVNVTLPGQPTITTKRMQSEADRCKFPEDR